MKARVRPLFTQDCLAASAGKFLDGILSGERRKTGWMLAEAAGDSGPWQGHASCGVARQYTGSARKITNCQIGVFAPYVSHHGHAFIDRALYLLKAWADDTGRREKAHVPKAVDFTTKPALARAMIRRALAADVPFPWVAADSVYGVGDIEKTLRRAGKGYVLGVNSNHSFSFWGGPSPVAGTAQEIAAALPADAWKRISSGDGTKGARLHDWVSTIMKRGHGTAGTAMSR